MTVPIAGMAEGLVGALARHVAILLAVPAQLSCRALSCYMAVYNNFKQQHVTYHHTNQGWQLQLVILLEHDLPSPKQCLMLVCTDRKQCSPGIAIFV